jgi:NAD(P)-dependent dehydrogenase (short-subunit alcohol dehydrogenase family)
MTTPARATAIGTAALPPLLRAAGSGHIINIASVGPGSLRDR